MHAISDLRVCVADEAHARAVRMFGRPRPVIPSAGRIPLIDASLSVLWFTAEDVTFDCCCPCYCCCFLSYTRYIRRPCTRAPPGRASGGRLETTQLDERNPRSPSPRARTPPDDGCRPGVSPTSSRTLTGRLPDPSLPFSPWRPYRTPLSPPCVRAHVVYVPVTWTPPAGHSFLLPPSSCSLAPTWASSV
jgi:hypothetical protein